MTVDLLELFSRHGYHDASLFGHALEGNLHICFSQAGAGPRGFLLPGRGWLYLGVFCVSI